MPNLFHFAQGLPDQSETFAYGAKSETQFRVTSSFTMTGNEKAYAILQGTILLQKQTTANKVNLILKPSGLSGIKMPVKYIIYRGLALDSFINITDETVLTGGTELLDKMQEIQRKRTNTEPPATVEIPLPALFGYTPSPAPDETTFIIDNFFYTKQPPNSQLFNVEGGMELGCFLPGEGGIEIILENADFPFTVGIARRETHSIDTSNITDENEKHWTKDLIRHFVDPAAFYGVHADIAGGIEYRDNTVTRHTITGEEAVYSNIIDQFHTKNNVYLDIRNENGYSFDYYGNFDGQNFKINDTTKTYGTNDWPIYVLNGADLTSNTFFNLALTLTGNNIYPIIIARYVDKNKIERSKSKQDYLFIDNLKDVTLTDGYTKAIRITIPYIIVNGTGKHPASVIRIDYIRRLDDSTGDNNYFLTREPTDFLFGPINIDIPWQNSFPVKWKNSELDRYSNDESEITVWKSGMIKESMESETNFLYYIYPEMSFKSKKSMKFPKKFNFSGYMSPERTFFKALESKSKVEKQDFTHENTTKYLIKYNENIFDKIIKDDEVYFLGITETQRDGLNNAANNILSEFHHKFFKIEKLNDNIVPDGIFGYQLYLAGYSLANNSYAIVSSTPAIKLFTADNKIFCSAEYTQSILSTGLLTDKIVEVHFERPDDYEKGRNHFGFDWLREEYVDERKLCIQANIGVYDQNENFIRTDHYYNDEAREELKKEYTPFALNGDFYYVPWLTMYPNHQNTVNYIGDTSKHSVKLRIKLENADSLKKNDKIYFHLPNGIKVGLDNNIPSSNLVTIQEPRKLNKHHITIQCTTPSGDHRSIEVRDGTDIETSKLLGKLNISENNQLINLEEARFVHLFFEGDISKDNIDFDFHIDNNLRNLLNIRISSIDAEGNPQTTNYNNNVLNHNEWNNWIAKTHKITKSYLHQCLVDYNPDYETTNTNSIGEITAINIHSKVKIQFVSPHNHRLFRMAPGNNNWVEILDNGSNNLTDTLDLFEQAILDLRYDYEPLRKDNKVPSIIFDTDTITGRLNYLFGNYYNFLDYQENMVIICFPVIYGNRKRTEPIEKSSHPGGFHIERSKLIFLTGYPNSWMINDYTLAHEIGHRCSLDHTFLDNNSNDNSNKKRFVFKEKRITDNLMDYAEGDLIDESGNIIKQDVKESFWEWQKKIITYWFNNELPLE